MDNQTPTEKAIAMAQEMERLESVNYELHMELVKERQKHHQEMEVQKAYVAGIELTLNALLNRSVKL